VAIGLTLGLVGCGGGGSGLTATNTPSALAGATVLNGSAIDAPIAGAIVTITAGAPLNDTGALTIGTATANGTGLFTMSVSLPTGSVPIFANASDPQNPTVILSSYLGQSDVLIAAGTLNSSSVPDLDISPVTTAALAVYAQLNSSSYANLTPTTYATTVQQYGSDILAISSAIKAVGDNLCAPAITVTTTTNLAASIAAASNLSSGNSTTFSTVASVLGGNCATILSTLPQTISADPKFGPQLSLGDVVEARTQNIPAGSYQLQGVIAESGVTSANVAISPLVSPSVVTDTGIALSSTGIVTSTDGLVSGTLTGNLLNLVVNNGVSVYTLRVKIGVINSSLVTGATAYAITGGGTNNSTSVLTQFQAVLAPSNAVPVWNGIAAPALSSAQNGVTCAAGAFPTRLNAFGANIGGGSVGECITPSASGWSMAASTLSHVNFDFDHPVNSTVAAPAFNAPNWTELGTGTPFILTASNATYTNGSGISSTGTTYYVMGTPNVIYATASNNNQMSIEGNGNMLTNIQQGRGGDH
jgi:hypothetical protein